MSRRRPIITILDATFIDAPDDAVGAHYAPISTARRSVRSAPLPSE